jgi:hypothetical protein
VVRQAIASNEVHRMNKYKIKVVFHTGVTFIVVEAEDSNKALAKALEHFINEMNVSGIWGTIQGVYHID